MPSKTTYLPRIADKELAEKLASTGAVVIEGPKACGKTGTARRMTASEVLLDIDANARQAAGIDATLILGGEAPRLIDEWQLAPIIWNHIRRIVDDRGLPGQFILTGSAVPADDITRHTGAGRVTRLRLRPMSLYETGHANGGASIGGFLTGEFQNCPDPGLKIVDIAERLLKDLNLFVLLFESMVIRDLRVYAQGHDASILHYRDNTGLEVDAVVETGDGRWAAFEIKLGSAHIDEGAANLLKFAERVDTRKCGAPALLGVIVGTGFGYMRQDGVAVIPVGSLGP